MMPVPFIERLIAAGLGRLRDRPSREHRGRQAEAAGDRRRARPHHHRFQRLSRQRQTQPSGREHHVRRDGRAAHSTRHRHLPALSLILGNLSVISRPAVDGDRYRPRHAASDFPGAARRCDRSPAPPRRSGARNPRRPDRVRGVRAEAGMGVHLRGGTARRDRGSRGSGTPTMRRSPATMRSRSPRCSSNSRCWPSGWRAVESFGSSCCSTSPVP